MDSSGSVIAVVATAIVAGYLGYRMVREKRKLQAAVALLDDRDLPLIQSLEAMVFQGELRPAVMH